MPYPIKPRSFFLYFYHDKSGMSMESTVDLRKVNFTVTGDDEMATFLIAIM